MKIYDTHSDIFSNLYERKRQGVTDPFRQYHLDDLLKGDIKGGIWVIYSAYDFDVVSAYKSALALFAPYAADFEVVLGLEGLRNVANLETFEQLYQLGVRHASLTWNEQNHLATGVKGPSADGLTSLGKEFLKYMDERKIIVDVSHLNIKSFYQVLEQQPKLLIASHSNSYSLCPHPRNLNDDQLQALKAAGGSIGVVAARYFVAANPLKQNIRGLVDQVCYLVEIMGVESVMLGLDMMNYLSDFANSNLDDLKSHAQASGIICELQQRFSTDDIRKICYENFLNLKKRLA